MKEFNVKLGRDIYKVIDDSGDDNINIYIPDLFQLMLVDMKEPSDDFLNDIHDDIVKLNIHVYKYSFLGKSIFDFTVDKSSNWSDYPRPQSFTRSILKKIGKKTDLGSLTLAE